MTVATKSGADLARADAGRFRIVPYAELRVKASEVAGKILEQYAPRNESIVVAPILMGGGLPARLIIDALLPFRIVRTVVPCQIKRYSGLEQGGETQTLLPLARRRIKDQVVLGIDDLVDGGQTLAAFRDHAYAQGARAVDTAVIYMKPKSQELPGHFAEQGVSEWLVMPGEEHDFMNELMETYSEVGGLSEMERIAYFETLGLPADVVKDWVRLQRVMLRCTMDAPDYAKTKRVIF